MNAHDLNLNGVVRRVIGKAPAPTSTGRDGQTLVRLVAGSSDRKVALRNVVALAPRSGCG